MADQAFNEDMFDGVEKAKASFDSNYVRRGHYLALITKVKADQNRQDQDFVAVEMTILHTHSDGDGKELQGTEEAGTNDTWHRAGEDVSHIMMKKHDSFLGNLKSFIANVMDVDPADVTKATCVKACCQPDQPMAGRVVELKNRVIQTRAGNDFTKVSYVRELEPKEYAGVVDQEIINRYLPDIDERLAE